MPEQMDFALPMTRPIQPFDEVCAGLKFFDLSRCVTIPSRALPTEARATKVWFGWFGATQLVPKNAKSSVAARTSNQQPRGSQSRPGMDRERDRGVRLDPGSGRSAR